MEEKITKGLSVKRTELYPNNNLVQSEELKAIIGINYESSIYETRIEQINTGIQRQFEKQSGVCIFPNTIDVSWVELYDYEFLPFSPVLSDFSTLVLNDLENNVIDSVTYQFLEVQKHRVILKGDFPKGVKFTYQAGLYSSVSLNGLYLFNYDIRTMLLSAGLEVFEEKNTISGAISKQLKNYV